MEGGTDIMADAVTALTTGFTTVATSITGAIGDLLPIVIPIAGTLVLIGIGYKVFKRFAK